MANAFTQIFKSVSYLTYALYILSLYTLLIITESSEPVVQVNTWMANTSTAYILSPVHTPFHGEDRLVLEDMQTDEEKLQGSLLSSESAFLPVSSAVRSPSLPDSEEEDLDEPDSLAPPKPVRSHPQKAGTATSKHIPLNQNHFQTDVTDNTAEEGENLQTDRMVNLQALKTASATKAGPDLRRPGADEAAVRIQAWWRGYWTRQHHPQAKEVRGEIRLRRLQDHIVYLTAELER